MTVLTVVLIIWVLPAVVCLALLLAAAAADRRARDRRVAGLLAEVARLERHLEECTDPSCDLRTWIGGAR